MPRPAITRVPNLAISPVTSNKNNGLYLPPLTTVQRDAIPPAAIANGCSIYNTTANSSQAYIGGVWKNINSSVAPVGVGVGLVAGSTAVILPSGINNTVEVADNQINGFIYYGTTTNSIRARVNGAWVTVQTA